MADTQPASRGPGSRALIIGLLVGAAIVAVLPVLVARSRRVQLMRADLAEVIAQCSARYAAARTEADSAGVDGWRPALHGVQRPGDPACGLYRRRNMIR